MALDMSKVQARKEKADQQSNQSNYEFWVPKDGKNLVRIMPPANEKDLFWAEGYVHFSVGPDNKMATCLSTFGKKCPICDAVDKLKASKNKDDITLSGKMRKTQRVYMSIIDRDSEEDDDKVVVMGCGSTIFKEVLNMICDPDWGDITDLESGRDVTITKKGKGMKTEYSVLGKPKSTVASETLEDEEVMTALIDLDTIFSEKTFAELEALLDGIDISEDDDDEDEDEDENPDFDEMTIEQLLAYCKESEIVVPKSARTSKLKLIALIEAFIDSDDESDTEEKEDAEEEKPAGKGTSGKANAGEDALKDEIANALKNRKKK